MSRAVQRRAARAPETIGILIASYRRPADLRRCLLALPGQSRAPDEVIVVARVDDSATHALLSTPEIRALPWLRLATVVPPGLVAARNAGLDALRSDIVVMIDDDTVPHADWLERLLAHYADATVGAVGGRDRCHDGERFDEARAAVVGRLQWFGRAVGNHHRGHGAARDVDFLKGANMSYRAEAVRTLRGDPRLRGRGAVPHEDLAFSLAVGRAGWRILYDPLAVLDHYAGRRDEPRHYHSVAPLHDPQGFAEQVFNGVVAIWDSLDTPARRLAFLVWASLVGTVTSPGLIQALRFTPRLGRDSWRRFRVAERARREAYRALRSQPGHGIASMMAGSRPGA